MKSKIFDKIFHFLKNEDWMERVYLANNCCFMEHKDRNVVLYMPFRIGESDSDTIAFISLLAKIYDITEATLLKRIG